jgi:hypothetical protein
MNEMTPQECAERLDKLAFLYPELNPHYLDAIKQSAAVMRKLAAGELVEVKPGQWERIINPYGKLEGFICQCGHQSQSASNFCPNCGASMDSIVRRQEG